MLAVMHVVIYDSLLLFEFGHRQNRNQIMLKNKINYEKFSII